MTISTPTKTTIQVKLTEGTRTPIDQVLNVGMTGSWIIGKNHNLDSFTTVEIWDESTQTVYISPIMGIVKLRPNKEGKDVYGIVFDRFDVTSVRMDFKNKGFRFSGHGVRMSV